MNKTTFLMTAICIFLVLTSLILGGCSWLRNSPEAQPKNGVSTKDKNSKVSDGTDLSKEKKRADDTQKRAQKRELVSETVFKNYTIKLSQDKTPSSYLEIYQNNKRVEYKKDWRSSLGHFPA